MQRISAPRRRAELGRRVVGLLVALFCGAWARPARAERDLIVPFHEGGHLVLDQLSGLRMSATGVGYAGPAGLAFRSEKSDAVTPGGPNRETSTTTLWLAPSADVFVTEHLSVGGRIEVGHTWGAVEGGGQRVELPGTTSLTLVPRVGFYVPVTDRIGVWPRAGVGYTRVETARFVSTGSPVAEESFRSVLLEVDLGLVYRFTETFFVKTGPELGVTLGGRSEQSLNGTSVGAGGAVLQIAGTVGFGVNLEL